MKIISKFKDYYDNAVHPAYKDDSIIYVRKTSYINDEFDRAKISRIANIDDVVFSVEYKDKWNNKTQNRVKYSVAYLLLAGKTFGVLISPYYFKENVYVSRYETYDSNILGISTIDTFLKLKEKELLSLGYSDIKITSNNASPDYTGQILPKNYSRFKSGEINFDSTEVCLKYGTPVILVLPPRLYGDIDDPRLILNPNLQNLNLMNVIDPFQTWQEISMFIGGVIPGRQSPMVKLSDESKIQKAGFDPKYGFRTRPSKDR